MTIEDKNIDNIVDLLDQDYDLTDRQLAEILQNDEAKHLAKDALAIKACLRESNDPVDIDAEWSSLRQRMKTDDDHETPPSGGNIIEMLDWKKVIYVISSIAAIAIMGFFMIGGMKTSPDHPEYEYAKIEDENPNITITSKSSDEAVTLAEQTDNATTATSAAKVQSRIWKALGYETDNVPLDELTITIPSGKSYQLTLPDGTEVWMYAGTKLTYPTRFIGGERNVYLEGEAYFKVTKDPEHPFVIATKDLEARVLGTELCVSSCQNFTSKVALIRGVVEVKDKADNSYKRLSPGQTALLGADRLSVISEDMEKYEFWRTGYLYFDEESLLEIATRIGKWYNVNVIFDDKALKDLKFRFFCKRDESLRRAIDLLNSYGAFTATLTDETLHIKHLQGSASNAK